MTEVLIAAADADALSRTEKVVFIDTRNPDAYAAGHAPGAVNIHEIFTYLATSTPEGIDALKSTFAQAFGKTTFSPCHQRESFRLCINIVIGANIKIDFVAPRLRQGQDTRSWLHLGRCTPSQRSATAS